MATKTTTKEKNRLKELEEVILDQIEKLNDDSIMEDADKARILIDRSKSISELTDSFVSVNRMKLDVVKELGKSLNADMYTKYLGVDPE